MLTIITLLPMPDAKVKRKTILKVNKPPRNLPQRLKRLSGETKQEQRQKVKKAKPIGYCIISIETFQQSIQLKSSRDLPLQAKQSAIVIL